MKIKYLYRCIALILMTALLPVFAYADFSAYSESDRETYMQDAALLQKLGVLDETPDITKTVTRSEYAKILVSLVLGECNISEETEIGFSDVGADNENAAYIYQGYNLRLFSGFDDGTYRPNDMIMVEDAVASLVKAMGYRILAEEKGGFPSGYLTVASQNGIFDGLDIYIGYNLTYGTFVRMLINSFGAEFLVPIYTNTSNDINYKKGENGFLERLRIEKKVGIVTANKYTHLTNDSTVAKNALDIDGQTYFTEEDYSDFLGYKVVFYVSSEGNRDEIVYIARKSSMNREKLITAEDLYSYSQRTYEYSEGDRNRRLTLPTRISIIYNGVCAAEPTAAMMKPENGEVRFVDNNNDGVYDVLFITDYETWIVKSVAAEDKRIYDMDKNGYLDLSEADFIHISDTDGNEITLPELKRYNVLSVTRSQNGRAAGIIVSSSTVKDVITSFSGDGKVEIGGKEYEVLDFVGIDRSCVGKSGTFFLDFMGKIAYFIDNTLSGMAIGFLVDAQTTNSAIDSKMMIKLYSTDERMLVLNCTERIKIDGVKYRDSEKAITALRKGETEISCQPVLYKTDERGDVTEINTPYNSADNPNAQPGSEETADSLRLLTKIVDAEDDVIWQNGSGLFNGKISASTDFILFNIPGSPKTANEREFSITEMSGLDEQPACESVEFYSADSNNLISSIGVMYGSSGSVKPGGAKYGVIANVATVLNEGNEVTKVTIEMHNGSRTVLFDPSDATVIGLSDGQTLHVGDFVEYYAGASGYISWMNVLYIHDSEDMNVKQGSYWAKSRAASGYVFSREKDIISISAEPISGELAQDTLDVQDLGRYKKIMQYDSKRNILFDITANEIYDWKSVGLEYSKIIYCTDQGTPLMMICYK